MILLWTACTQRPVILTPSPTEVVPDSGTPPPHEPLRVYGENPPEADDIDPADNAVHVELIASVGAFRHDLKWAYNGNVPGPTIRANVGDNLTVGLHSDLPADTSIHWHGVHLPWEMDGADWQQTPVPPGGDRLYTFALDRAGTFWYHPHFDSEQQVDRGLVGVLVVEDPSEPKPDVEWTWVLDVHDETLQDSGDTGSADPHAEISATPAWVINGAPDPEWHVAGGTTVRVRILNASNQNYLQLDWPGARAIGGDQGLLAAPTEVLPLLAPGDRLVVDLHPGMASTDVFALPFSSVGGPSPLDTPTRLATVIPDTPATSAAPLPWAFTGGVPATDQPADIVFTLTGDGDDWRINQQTWPDVTIPEVKLGADVVVEVRNLSSSHHPWHVHGLPFDVLSVDGMALGVATREDTIDVAIGQTVRTRLSADLAGDWMAHCHILPHAHDGMMTVIRVLP